MLDNAFAWLRYIMEWLGQFIPRWDVVKTTHGWVKWTWRQDPETMDRTLVITEGGPGLVWWFPAVTQISMFPVVRQTVPLPTQIITVMGGKTVAASGMIVYRVSDLKTLLCDVYDPDDTVKDIASSALSDVLCRLTWEEIQSGQARKTLDTQLRNAAKKDLQDYGVEVIKFSLTNCSITRTIRIIQSTFQEGEIS